MTVNGLQDTEHYCYFTHYRPWPNNTRRKLEMVIQLDARFVAEQTARGKSTEDLECLIARFQQDEAEEVKWAEEKARREQQSAAEKQRRKEAGYRMQADLYGEQLREVARELVLSGALNDR